MLLVYYKIDQSTDPYMNVLPVSQVMTSKRYKKIIENLHLNNNSNAVPKGQQGYDKLYKVRPLIEKLNQSFQSHYIHSSYLSVDESMILFKGRSSIKQYMPLKPIKRGYNFNRRVKEFKFFSVPLMRKLKEKDVYAVAYSSTYSL